MKLVPNTTNGARILIVDDERSSAHFLSRILEAAGYPICITLTDPLLAIERFKEINPDLVLLDLHMAPIDGIEVLKRINQIVEPRLRPPILVITGDTTAAAMHQALQAGATDFLSKPLDCLEVQLRIKQLLHGRALFQQCQNYSEQMKSLVEERTAKLQKQTHDLELTIDELKETQQQVIQQERLRAVGTMASGIAHDLNNGLSLIMGYGDLLLQDEVKFPPGSQEHRYLGHMVRAGQDNATLVKRLRNFYRPCASSEERQLVDLNELAQETISLTSPRWGVSAQANAITITVKSEFGKIPQIAGSPEELREVLTNLIFNAVDALPYGGCITFRTYAQGDRVLLEVSDNGSGMTLETQQRCLEPFYSTKGAAGSGLGLSMSYGIIRRHGGSITIKSELRQGTTFVIDLPVSSDKVLPTAARSREPVRRLRTLVVDDQPGICEIVSAYLAVDGHIVETAASGREALEKFDRADFDLIITDRAMPETNGIELAAAIKRLQPQKPVIMLTGFASGLESDSAAAENVDLVVNKPVCLDDLREAIHKVMRHPEAKAIPGARSNSPRTKAAPVSSSVAGALPS
jgi:signal transduction histidine kinase